MSSSGITHLIINSPFEEPSSHWSYVRDSKSFTLKGGRRPAGYVTATPGAKSFDDPGIFREMPLVNQIRPRVTSWSQSGYPGTSGITQRLLEHWKDASQRDGRRFFFCQLEAIETLIWLAEAPASEKVGIEIPSDGGDFTRLCTKMATGSGKTIVMAMLIAWQILNKATYPQDRRFSKYVFIVAPGLTVRNRLEVLKPDAHDNYYELFNILPAGLHERLRQGRVVVKNWHALMPLDPNAGPRVVKKGPESDEAFVRRVLERDADYEGWLVINDEAHHAWRVPPKASASEFAREELEEATQWIGGLDRIHAVRGILSCYDLSATPFAPTGKRSTEETLFSWVVSDFGLNDAIESGLVKTPRVVIRDDGRLTADYRSRLYHIYTDPEVRDDINRRAEEQEPLPDLILQGYYLLGKDWLETAQKWAAVGAATPPVMITVANRTETAARIKYTFDHGKIRIDELCAPEQTLHIDSKVLEKAESREEVPEAATNVGEEEVSEETEADLSQKKLSKKDHAELLRRTVDSVGKVGTVGELIQNVISVGMLSEGWDAKTVTHIMGLRAFTSQLLCEQVVGRGLRRTAYELNPDTNLLEAEYVNIFGVPFTFLPHEGGEGAAPPPPSPKTEVKALSERAQYELTWPSVARIDYEFRPKLTLNIKSVPVLQLDASSTPTVAELAPIVEGKPDVGRVSTIDLEKLGARFRRQRIIFEAARDVYDQVRPTWRGNREMLLAQVIQLVEKFVDSERIVITPSLFNQDDMRRRIMLTVNMTKIVQHLFEQIRFENVQTRNLVFDRDRPTRSTADMRPWYTGRPCELTRKSQINFCSYDSTWEATEAYELDRSAAVDAWAKNDHLGFEILYLWQGIVKKFRPDFLVRLTNSVNLVVEVKGQDTHENRSKRQFLDEWVQAVNEHGGFGHWRADVVLQPKQMLQVLERHASAPAV